MGKAKSGSFVRFSLFHFFFDLSFFRQKSCFISALPLLMVCVGMSNAPSLATVARGWNHIRSIRATRSFQLSISTGRLLVSSDIKRPIQRGFPFAKALSLVDCPGIEVLSFRHPTAPCVLLARSLVCSLSPPLNSLTQQRLGTTPGSGKGRA